MERNNTKSYLKSNWLSLIIIILIIGVFIFDYYSNVVINKRISEIVIQQNTARLNPDFNETSSKNRFHIYYSPRTEKSTFLIDDKEGRIYNLVEDPSTKKLWWVRTNLGEE